LLFRVITNVERQMYDYTGNNWSNRNSNQSFTEKFGSCMRKTFYRLTTKDSCTWNITHNTESTAVWSLKPERWGSPLVQEKYQEENACDKRHPYRIDSLQKTAILGTSHIIRRVMQCEAWSLSGGDHRWFKRSTGEVQACDKIQQQNNIIIIVIAARRIHKYILSELMNTTTTQ